MKCLWILLGLILLCGCVVVEEEYSETIYLPPEPTTTSLMVSSTTTSTTLPLEILLRMRGLASTSTTTSSTTSSTFVLKHQGNFSSNKVSTTTTSSTLPILSDWMTYCVEDKDCVIHYGCCPCDNPTALNKNAEKTWSIMLRCPLTLKCYGGLKPCWYKAYCVNKTCVRRLE